MKAIILAALANLLGVDSSNYVTLTTPPPYGDNSSRLVSASWAQSNIVGIVGDSRKARMSIPAAGSTATFTADEVILETAIGGQLLRASSVNVSVDLTKTGAGGMDTGAAPASGYVALYLIKSLAGALSLLAVNATAAAVPQVYGGANMPAGYVASALVAVVPTNSSSQFLVCKVQGKRVLLYSTTAFAASVVASSITSASIATTVPKNATKIGGYLSVVASQSGYQTSFSIYADSTGLGAREISGASTTQVPQISPFDLEITSPQSIAYTLSTGASAVGAAVYLTSYEFE